MNASSCWDGLCKKWNPASTAPNNSDVPAGFTYLGQFVDHDITLDRTVGFPAGGLDPEEIEQAPTQSLDLDSLYGLRPKMQPQLRDSAKQPPRRALRHRTPGGTFVPPTAQHRAHPRFLRPPDANAHIVETGTNSWRF